VKFRSENEENNNKKEVLRGNGTYEKRSTGFGDDVNFLAAEDVAEDEGQDQHHDLQEDSDAGGLLLLAGSLASVRRRNF